MDDLQISFNNSFCEGNEMDDDWDPMRDEYENPNINAYQHGPGANLDASLQRPAYRDRNNQIVYKIMVGRCPPGLSSQGLENLFMNFGTPNISKMKKENDHQIIWALIEYKTLKEAETAIKTLNSSPPYNLSVKFARSDEEQARLHRKKMEEEALFRQLTAAQPQMIQDPTSSQDPSMDNIALYRMIGRGQSRGRAVLNGNAKLEERRPGRRGNAWSEGIPDFVDAGLMYNQNSCKYEGSNRYLQNIVISTGSDSLRKVSIGRGYVPPENRGAFVPSTVPQVKKSLGHDICIPLQRCTNCNSETGFKCSQCGAPYCSRKCQKEDFIRHKPRCSFKESIDVVMDTSIQQSARLMPLKEVINSTQGTAQVQNTPINQLWGRQEKNVVSLLQEETTAVMMIYSVESGNICGQLSFDKVAAIASKLFVSLPSVLNGKSRDNNFWPAVGSLVAVRLNDSVWRGYILSSPSIGQFCDFTVALCDIGIVQKVKLENILPLPSVYQDLQELGVTCNVIQANSDLSAVLVKGESLSLKVNGALNNQITAQFQTEAGHCATVSLSAWVPSVPNYLVPVQITPPCQVVISTYHHQHAIYVQPVGREYQEHLFSIMQKVTAAYVTSPPLGRAPYKGEMVGCQFQKDGNFYRGIVQEESKDGEYTVFFVDFGNLDAVSLKNMKALPEELKNIPCMSVKVSLKGVRPGPLSDNAVYLLNSVTQTQLHLKLECLNPSEGVVLTRPNNSSLNTEVNDMLVPNWKHAISTGKEPHSGEVFMLEDLKILPLTKGDQSNFANVVVLNITSDGEMAVCPCPDEFPEVGHVLQTLTDQINEYCGALDSNIPYHPRRNEVCLAKYHKDGLWYRAVNAATSQISQSCSVGFLDYGNTENVEFKDIRRMPPDFMSLPAIMSYCRIEGVRLPPTEAMVMRLKELLPPNKRCEIKILDVMNVGHFKVFIPEISDQLKSEFNF